MLGKVLCCWGLSALHVVALRGFAAASVAWPGDAVAGKATSGTCWLVAGAMRSSGLTKAPSPPPAHPAGTGGKTWASAELPAAEAVAKVA